MKTTVVVSLALSVMCASPLFAQDANAPVTLRAELSGANEVPTTGDPDGSGTASITIDPAKRQVCYDVTVAQIDPATMAHIHKGAKGEGGPPVVSLSAPKDGSAKGCVGELDAAVLRDIIANPAGYYVNVHTSSYRAGAVRGQLAS